jgi:hypothetical protein
LNLSGLAADKAPPAAAPLTLFWLLPPFLALAGIMLACDGRAMLASRWHPATLALTHLLVLGALTPVMCGAVLQVMPVLLGAPVGRVRALSSWTAAGLAAGTLLLAGGFMAGRPWLLQLGAGVLFAGLTAFLFAAGLALRRAARGPAATGVRIALAALAVTVGLGVLLVLSRTGLVPLQGHPAWVDLHAAWGLAGWLGLLALAVGMELIPMFYVTQSFAPALRRGLAPAVGAALSVALAWYLIARPAWAPAWPALSLLALHLAFHLAALRLESRRQRPSRDATLALWQFSHLAFAAAVIHWLIGRPGLAGAVLLLGAALCFVTGALLKILPFLSWLDLQRQRGRSRRSQVTLPRLRELLPYRVAAAAALGLIAATALATAAVEWPLLTLPAGLSLLFAAAALGWAMARVTRLRGRVSRALTA